MALDNNGFASSSPQIDTYGLSDLGYKIFLDRYALKDVDRANIREGDIVIAILSEATAKDMNGKREVARVQKIDGEHAEIVTQSGEEHRIRIEHIDKPVEVTPTELRKRVARGIASVESSEEKQREWEDKFDWLLEDWKFAPGGRILTAAGTNQQLSSYNCFVINSPKDSRSGIFESLQEMAEIMSRGGGVGFNASSLRPRYAYVKGVNGRSSGAVSWGALFSYVTGLIEQAGCVTGDTRIATDRGLLRMDEIIDRIRNKNERIWVQTHLGLREITDTFDNGRKRVLRITTKKGFSAVVTGNHPMLFLSDGKVVSIRADYLVRGDKLLLLAADGDKFNTSEPELRPTPEEVFTSAAVKRHKTPDVMNPELAYLIGYSYGDGWADDLRLELATDPAHPAIEDRLVEVISNLFGKTPQVRQQTGDASNRIVINSKAIIAWLTENHILKEKSLDIRVPDIIFKSSADSQMAFVAGYFDADGSIGKKRKEVKFSSIAIEFLRDIQMILAANGIISQLKTWERRQNKKHHVVSELAIRGSFYKQRFSEQAPTCKKTENAVGTQDRANRYPASIVADYPERYTHRSWNQKTETLSTMQMVKIANDAVEKHQDIATSIAVKEFLNLATDEVASIEDLGYEQTWDITVEETHSFSANGLYTGNSRRGALMIILNDWHPDLLEFINAKRTAGQITNANISVGVSDAFMDAVKRGDNWTLRFPDTQHPQYNNEWDGDLQAWIKKGYPVIDYRTLPAKEIWDAIIESAWSSAEPGLWFNEYTNQMSNSYYYPEGKLIATNPCGEEPLPANGVCNLGAINLGQYAINPFATNGLENVDWDKLRQAVEYATRFLDNVVDYTYYVNEANEYQQQRERRLGLGSLGIAELMIRSGIRYGSEAGVEFAEEVYSFIAKHAYLASSEIAKEKGAFTWFNAQKHLQSGFMRNMPEDVRKAVAKNGVRNVVILTSAPTGTVGTMLNTSTGIEPYFGWKWYRQGRLGWHEEKASIVQEYLSENNIAIPDGEQVEDYLPDYFVTAMELTPYEHVAVMAAGQRWIDSAISKTINCPNEYTKEQTAELYTYLYEMGCKGGTIYRDGSRDEQVLHRANQSENEKDKEAVEKTNTLTKVAIPTRPETLYGKTLKTGTPIGTAYITINTDAEDNPFEVFITIGKAGTDVQAEAESLGRLLSLSIQMQPASLRRAALEMLINQLTGIGGSRQMGFGPNRVLSVQDAIARAIHKSLFSNGIEGTDEKHNPYENMPQLRHVVASKDAEKCPSCGNTTLIRQDGCKKCITCEHSEC